MSIESNFNQAIWQVNFLDSMQESPRNEHTKDEEDEIDETKELPLSLVQTASQKEVSAFFPLQILDAIQFQTALSNHHIQNVQLIAVSLFKDNMKCFNDLKDICIAYTGSDGRNEKLSPFSSPLELMFIVKRQENLHSETLNKVQEFVSYHPTFFYGRVEVRCLENDSLICYNRNLDWKGKKDNRSFPTRALDAHYLVGSLSIFTDYKTQFYQELQDAKNIHFLKSFKKDAIQPTMSLFKRTIEQSTTSDINIETSIAFCDDKRVKGTKYPFLRVIQYKLGLHICSQIQKGKMSLETFIAMPSSTIERIQWLASKSLLQLNQIQVEELQKSYAASLIWFGIVQKNYEVHGKSQTQLPSEELKSVARTISIICQDKKIFVQ